MSKSGKRGLLLAAAFTTALAGHAMAQQKEMRIGFVGPFSGPTGSVGEQTFSGVATALRQRGDKIAGVPVKMFKIDDQGKPEIGIQLVTQLIERDHVDALIGPIFSNVLLASFKTITAAKIPVISPGAGPSQIAGRECSPYFFNTSWQNDQPSASMGRYMQDKGIKNIAIVALNFQGGRDAIAGFRSQYKGNVIKEFWTGMQEVDFAPVLAEIRSLKPDASYIFMPGGVGIAFIRQYAQAGLLANIPMYSASTIDGISINAVGTAVAGTFQTASYNYDMQNPANDAFRAEFAKDNKGEPSFYVAYGYDAIQLLDAGVTAAGGDPANHAAVAAGMAVSHIASVRGNFRLNSNHFPVQDFSLLEVVVKDGKPTQVTRATVLPDFADAYAGQCEMAKP